MKAIEFKAQAKNGIIKIPEEYKELANAFMRIIILTEEEIGLEKKEKIKQLLEQIKIKNIFKTIDNPSDWQRNLRNEWE